MTQNADYADSSCDHLGRRWLLGQCLMCGGDDAPPSDHEGIINEVKDIIIGWCRPMTDRERLESIARIVGLPDEDDWAWTLSPNGRSEP